MIDQLRALAVFARVAETGSFRAAARALSLSPSVVSHHVRELEARVGLPLLYRTTRRVSLTPDGDKLFASAREMLAAAERGLDELRGRSAAPAGTLRLTAPAFLGDTAFPRDLAAYALAHPRVQLVVSIGDMPRDLLRDGFDLAIRIGTLEDSTHRARRLAEMRRVLVASPRYLAERAHPSAPRDLAGWDLVQLSSRPASITLAPRGRGKPVTVEPALRVSVDSAAAARDFVVAGAGVATLPEVVVRAELARGRLVELLPRWTAPSVGVYAVWPPSTQRATLALGFVDFIAPRLAALFGAERGNAA